jgi:F-type H+-transporting ATPase subunit b
VILSHRAAEHAALCIQFVLTMSTHPEFRMNLSSRFAARLVALAPLALAGVALAQHGADDHAHGAADHGHAAPGTAGVLPTIEQGIVPMVVSLVVFAIVFAILAAKVWPAISKGLKDREDKIRSEIEAAELAQQQAQNALKEYERNLAQARAEAQRMLDEAKNQQQAIAAELRARSEAELNQMREKAKRDIESAKAAAVIELNGYAASLATDMARKILKRDINAGDQQRLIQESLAELQGAGRN